MVLIHISRWPTTIVRHFKLLCWLTLIFTYYPLVQDSKSHVAAFLTPAHYKIQRNAEQETGKRDAKPSTKNARGCGECREWHVKIAIAGASSWVLPKHALEQPNAFSELHCLARQLKLVSHAIAHRYYLAHLFDCILLYCTKTTTGFC